MKSDWLKGVEDPDKFEKLIKSSQEVIDKLKQICYNKRDELLKTRLTDYTVPNWAQLRSYQDGRVAELENLISLLTLDQREG